eukprot:8783336-Pyramimonas_sp.AAC.1
MTNRLAPAGRPVSELVRRLAPPRRGSGASGEPQRAKRRTRKPFVRDADEPRGGELKPGFTNIYSTEPLVREEYVKCVENAR